MLEPKYDEDVVNLGYLKRALGLTDEEAKDLYKYISRHYGSKPQPPYYVGDTWIDGDIVYTCVKERLIGIYQDSDWVTESGAKKEAEKKNKVFLRQPNNYAPGDMWILQSDTDHKAGKKGEMLIATTGRQEYDEDDWVNMLGYGTIRSINEVANNINDALIRLKLNKEEGIVTIYYSESIPENAVEDDLWYLTEELQGYEKGKVYKYDGSEWELVEDELAIVAFEEANEARLVADGKIQSFYSEEEPTQNIGVGDIWTDTTNNKLYRYNGTKWIAVYDTNISEIRIGLDRTIERTTTLETDLGEITAEVSQIETEIATNLVTNETLSSTVREINASVDVKVGEVALSVEENTEAIGNITDRVSQAETEIQANTDEIALMGKTSTEEGYPIEIDASNNPAKIWAYGNTQQATRSGKNLANISILNSVPSISTGQLVSLNDSGCSEYVELDNSKKYFLSYERASGSGSVYIMFYDNNKTYLGTSGSITSGYDLSTYSQFTSVKYIRIRIDTFSTLNWIQLEQNIQVTDYEQYGVSPSPDYPSDIRNVGDNINLLKLTDGTYTNNGITAVCNNGIISLSGTATSNSFIRIPIINNIILKANKQYTFSANNIKTYGDNTNYCAIRFNTGSADDSSTDVYLTSINASKVISKNTDTQYYNFTFRTASGITYNNTIIKPKLEEGSTLTPYTPYNCGSIDFKIQNRNLFSSEMELGSLNNTTGAEANNNSAIRTKDFVGVKPNTTYTISNNKNYYIYSYEYDVNYNFIKYTGSQTPTYRGKTTITTDINTQYIKWRTVAGNVENDLTSLWQLEKGTEATQYVPHQEQNIQFPLAEGQVLHKGDYLAEDGIHQVRKTVVLDGTETGWVLSGTEQEPYINISDAKIVSTNTPANALSSHFKIMKRTGLSDRFFAISSNKAFIFYDNNYKNNLNGWKTNLANNPITVEYELAEEIVIPYTAEQLEYIANVRTLKGKNYIDCIDEIKPEKLVVEYYPDIPINDLLVNKDEFERQIKETNAQIDIKSDSVATSVSSSVTSSILTLLNNGYLTAEQVNALVNGNIEEITNIKNQLTQTITDTQMQIAIQTALEGGVSYLKNTLFTIDENGMAIATNQDEFNALYNNRGMKLYSYDNLIAEFSVTGVLVKSKMIIENEIETPNLLIQNVTESGANHTYIHWIGG